MPNNTDPTGPEELPEIPEEAPIPEKTPEVQPVNPPENPPLPAEDPGIMPAETPFQPEIPTEVPPAVQ